MKKRKNLVNISTKIEKENKKTKALECVEGQEKKSQKNRRKVFKALGFSSLAVLMVSASVFAFAPLGNSMPAAQNNAEAEVAETLITPKADDPVIATLEGGLEIKWGEAAVINGGGKETGTYTYNDYASANSNITAVTDSVTSFGKLTSGNLNGFPYFTTIIGSTTYTWVIIGRNSNVTMNGANGFMSTNYSSSGYTYKNLSAWKDKINSADQYQNFIETYSPTHKSFFNNTYETASPAGAAINDNGLLSSQTARHHTASATYPYTPTNSNVKVNSEIPSGCVLVLANDIVGTAYYSSSGGDIGSGDLTTRSSCTLANLGLTSLSSRIQKTTVQRRQWDGSVSTQSNLTLFSLGAVQSSFKYSNYLTAAQIKLSSNVWTGDSYSGYVAGYINTSGGYSTGSGTRGLRPAFVLKVT